METVLSPTLVSGLNESPASLSPTLLIPAFLTGEESSEEQAALSLIESPGLPISPLPPELLTKIFEMVVFGSSSTAEANQNIYAIRKTCKQYNCLMENVLLHVDRDLSLMEKPFGPYALALTPAFLSLPRPSGYCSKLYDRCHYEAFLFRLSKEVFPERDTEQLSKKFLVDTVVGKLKNLIKPHLRMGMNVQAALASAPFIPGSICRTMQHLVDPMSLLECAALGNPQHPEVVEFLMCDPVRERSLNHAIPNLLSQMAERHEFPTEKDVQIVNSLYRHSVEKLLQAHFFFSGMYEYGEVDERVVYTEQALLKLGGKFTAKNWESACEFSKPVKNNELFLAELFSILGERYAHFTDPQDIKCIDVGLKALIWARLSVKELNLISQIKTFLSIEHFNGILAEIKNTYVGRGFPYQWDRLIKPFESKEGKKFLF